MAIKVKLLGIWRRYTPDKQPEFSSEMGSVQFSRRDSDEMDWYTLSRKADEWPEDSLAGVGMPLGDGTFLMAAIVRDPGRLFPQAGQILILITGHDPLDLKPHKSYEQMIFDPKTRLFFTPPPDPVLFVSAIQAKIQLSRMPSGKSDLLAATDAFVKASGDRELQLWYAVSPIWRLDNPNLEKIRAGLSLTATALQSIFDLAAKIAE